MKFTKTIELKFSPASKDKFEKEFIKEHIGFFSKHLKVRDVSEVEFGTLPNPFYLHDFDGEIKHLEDVLDEDSNEFTLYSVNGELYLEYLDTDFSQIYRAKKY